MSKKIKVGIGAETGKAFMVTWNDDTTWQEAWIPKSQVKGYEPAEDSGFFIFELEDWIFSKKGIPEYKATSESAEEVDYDPNWEDREDEAQRDYSD